jgi:hypothetical protein
MMETNGSANQTADYIDKGKLQINVFSNEIGAPVKDAAVRISNNSNGKIIEEVYTDSSGQTPVIDLPAPPLEYSLTPGSPKPYSEYNVSVQSQGYEPVNFEGVQILPQARALQNANVIPIQNGIITPESIEIKPHTLYAEFPPKIPEDEVKPLPESSGLVVLPKPVVPEFVIVHLGVPSDSSAKNVWVYFKDYIKNVASCEIYSTWTTETIKANVLAILSFTLNRVYTEWYTGKGYDFTITNSTAYDQSFSYGRNIYDSISVVVDDLFTTFVTRPNIRQPLFTQYCDGVRVQCKGLSQWGSQELGKQGLDAISIIRNYYGSDAFLMQAEKVEGVPRSYPGSPLQVGSSGANVRVIQEQLNAISNKFPALQKIKVDGIFGNQTQEAVKTFQRIFNLPVNGVVDFATWYAISNIYVSVMKMA